VSLQTYTIAETWKGRSLRITPVTPEERAAIIHDLTARRAFQNSKIGGSGIGHELKDWRQAESEILGPLNCGFLVSDRSVQLSADAVGFGEGEINIYVEPRHITICGIAANMDTRNEPESENVFVIRSLELSFEIKPAEATAHFKGRMTEMDLPTVRAMPRSAAATNAA
jgi:HSP20 family molecular chaperone IbpA